MITLENISKDYDGRTLLDDVTLSLFPNEKVGLTGPNGAGKTTLFSIILGEVQPSGGSVTVQKNIRAGYLPQEARFDSRHSVLEEVSRGDDHMRRLLAEKRELEDAHKADSMRYGDILAELETLGLYELEHRAEKVLAGLGFAPSDMDRPVASLSGGWQMRTLLAKLLVYPYDILLLDEPTNYLDLDATLWLKDYLTGYAGTFVVISHDKVFLNDVTNYTIVVDFGQLIKVKGNYENYERMKEGRLRTLGKKKKQLDKRRRQLERFTQRFHAQPNRASAVRNKRKMIERMEDIELPRERSSIEDFEFIQTPRSGYTVARLENVDKSFGDIRVYRELNLEVSRGQKLCLVGPNGAGKSTLLKMIAGVVPPDEGRIQLGHNVQRGYFSQTRLDVLNPHRNVLEEVCSAASGNVPAVKVRTLLGVFHFQGDDVFKPVGVLSGGEKSRVILAKLLVNPPNFILLDEPTTHLDIDGVEALTRAFRDYQGTLCFISHDLFFVREIANTIIEVRDGQTRHYPGGLNYYLDKKAGREAQASRVREGKKKEEKRIKKEARRAEREKTSAVTEALHRQHREAKRRIAAIKKEVRDLENEKNELETENYVKARVISSPSGRRDGELLKEYGERLKYIQRRLRAVERTIGDLNAEKESIEKGQNAK